MLAAEGEDTPSIPVSDDMEPESAITASTDAIAEEGKVEEGRGDLLVPYVPAARRFYLPQWVPFDEHDRLLVNSVSEAEADIKSMQRFLNVLFAARSLAPYVIADEEYHSKHYGMLGSVDQSGPGIGPLHDRRHHPNGEGASRGAKSESRVEPATPLFR